MEFKIGNVTIKNQVLLAPMAGITNEVYRLICRSFGAGLVVCEMISDKALGFRNEKTMKMTLVNKEEHPVSMQIFGADIDSLVEAAKYIDKNTDADIIDINMGCPVNKVAKKSGAGSALLKDPNNVYNIVKAVVDSVSKPVTVKIRLGWDSDSINCIENALMIEKAGASAITIHARTRAMLYSGSADWEWIKKVKESVSIPVIGNGDIVDAKTAKKMLDETKCDAIMIGRGALGNPWIFKEVNEYLDNGKIIKRPSKEEIYNIILKQHDMLLKLKGEHLALVEMRSHIGWYLKGLEGAAKVKNLCNSEKNFEAVKEHLKEFLLN